MPKSGVIGTMFALLVAGCAGGGNGGGGSGGSPGTGGSGTGGGAPGTGGRQTGSGGSPGTGGASTGGVTGSGGSAPGTGGSGTGGGAPGTGGTGVAPFFTDDFESDTAGQQPAGWDNFISYNYKTTNPQGDGTGALADATHTHNGSKLAVHFVGGSNPAFLERALPSGIDHLYMRVYVYLANAIGDGPQTDNHETLLGLTGDPTSVNTQVRFGQIKGVIGTNKVPSDNISPLQAQWYSGPVITANTWHCLQVEFDGSAAYNSLYATSDGTLVHSITATTDWQNAPTLPGTWMSGMFVDVLIGWQSFSSMANDVWMDDLALSTAPVSCD
jgi:hypothetical protein